MNKILVGLDGSDNSYRALEAAIDFAKFYDAELHTITAEGLPRFSESISEVEEEKAEIAGHFQDIVKKAQKIADSNDCAITTHVVSGHQVKAIIEFINENKIDLLVIGFVGRSALYDRIMGSTCQSLVRLAGCSVHIVK
jgi:nucleotide-binding universal stress UspA family protein